MVQRLRDFIDQEDLIMDSEKAHKVSQKLSDEIKSIIDEWSLECQKEILEEEGGDDIEKINIIRAAFKKLKEKL